MGDRAVIAFEDMPEVGIYLHWGGYRDSVESLIAEAKAKGLRTPGEDPLYAFARFVQVIADNFSENGNHITSVGVGPLHMLDTDNGDNGTYWLGSEWAIVRREHAPSDSD